MPSKCSPTRRSARRCGIDRLRQFACDAGSGQAPDHARSGANYAQPPAPPYETIAQLSTSSQGSFSFTAQAKTDAVINRLKIEAAKLGANGVVLQGIGDQASGGVGTGAGGDSFSRGGAVGGGVGINLETTRKVGGGLAIFVPPT